MAKKTHRSAVREERDPRGIQLTNQLQLQAKEEFRKVVIPNFHLQPKNPKQEAMIHAINHSEIIIAEAPAGCGKTYISGGMAAKFLSEGLVDKIILTRANVHVGKSLGMLPGTINEKMEPLLAPIISVLRERMGDGLYAYNMAKKKIEIQALEYIRGNSFKDCFIIIDEAQNLTKAEVSALVTRFESGRILFIGDNFQSDIKGENGLDWLEQFASRHNLDYPVIKFELKDIVRSDLVKKFLTALYSENK
jgi:phosphate starvation-inducible PhoH-like protein